MATNPKFINSNLEDTFWRDMGALPMVVDMMKTGIQINPEAFRELSVYFQIKMEELQSYILCLAGKDFDLGSPQQVGRVLFDDLKLKKIKGYSTDDKKVLSILKDAHPIVPLIRDWRGYQKLKSTYSDPMPDRAKEDGRIHATFRITRTDTGRLCVDPDTLIEAPRDMNKYPDGIPLRNMKKGDWIYSFDYNRELCLKKIKWIGPTKTSKTVIITYVDNDRGTNKKFRLVLSPEHLVRMFRGEWKHAAYVKPGDRLLCMVSRHNHGQGYYSLYSHSRNRGWGRTGGGKIKEHRFIWSQIYHNRIRLCSTAIVHHKDGNPQNNHPDNLEYCADGIKEHLNKHKQSIPYSKEELEKVLQTGIGRTGTILKKEWRRKLQNRYDKLYGRNHVVVCVEEGPVMQLWDLEIEDTHCFIGNEVALHNSTSNPNVMAQPVRNEESIKIRRGFIAKSGCKLVSGDYSQLEMRILAHMSEDPTLIRIFRNGDDVHSITASEMWHIPLKDLHPKKHRYPAKRINYLIAYGGGAYGLFNQFKQDGVTGYSLQDCQNMINRWYKVYSEVKSNYIDSILQFCRKKGYVKTLFGRIRYLPAIRSPNKWMQAEAERMAINTPIQGTASDIMKEAMRLLVPVYKELQTWGYIEPLLQVHDDLIWEIEDNLIDVAIPMIRTVMEHAVQLIVPTPIDPKVGESWGDMKKWTPMMSQ
jgi:hypothetical protein